MPCAALPRFPMHDWAQMQEQEIEKQSHENKAQSPSPLSVVSLS